MKKILVANRGEIAIRVIRAAQELGHKAVAIYETPDTEALHVRVADEAIWLGDGPRKDYLDIAKVIKAARKSGADAIHPGYGFLAENPEFAKACENAGLVFIGPTSEVITNLGNKVIAREIMAAANIPMVPGTSNLSPGDEGLQEALAFASEYGYPIMLKATAGGGGRGIRRIDNDSQMREELPMARTEAKAAFDNDNVYLEKVVINPKHVEVQIIADSFGEVVHLGTRDCSIQRRNQKLVEIAPSLIQDQSIIESICETAVKAAQASNYTNAGTVEFLVDKDMKYYFMEINTRIQVEHTVTEMVTGIDIVRTQIKLAFGKKLLFKQEEVKIRGHAIEMRINAEDPKNNFMPEGGKTVDIYRSPGGYGVRLDGFVYQGYTIPEVYDSLLVKLTVHGYSWNETVDRLRRCLKNFVIIGPKTTIPFYLELVDDPDFQKGDFDTSYLEMHAHLLDYEEQNTEINKLAKLIAEIHYNEENTYAV
ncbi:MAG: acetyl-CoA carboxylase biotin carboxylase subunit [Desulfobulbaceae bacterium]|jgi:acetyl-CoA carboxylase biotin carboxylase subunit|nr:acetyl-CoA carboxylase biotin carboxylase subunit [Desulfobulbaceae bacterium]MDH3776085.1 acetyl-CoA carboxylase biotin carboxylase subunit [Desulfobulbaceae bacterium]MDH3782246.1 acetyl-CoA carboxylase biotin carboxylase subunit [Desulfobulbaceae bacterium]MDH3866470.1 acetyl-CoA carboxylase biotin carboxylase subunit [Desulfobulbaceae bacterium]MDH3921305.1 acetyl-CoA carboxylase biotin carboxylase subunit [Desulfobulbaceae bacterium]